MSGGSHTNNRGTLISPLIEIGDVNATLKFNTWWEIESVNPNTNGYDLLEIYVVEENKDYNTTICSSKTDWLNSNKNSIMDEFFASDWGDLMKTNLANMQYSINCGKNGDNIEKGDLLRKLNPAIDPAGEFSDPADRAKIPFTSAGFNRKAIWNTEEFDLSKYRGKNIRIKFVFDTKDDFYNTFRGWMIDDLKVFDSSKINK